MLLRGVNVGRGNRIAMSDFASVVAAAGASDVRTLLNSGNAVCTTSLTPQRLAEAVRERLVSQLGLDVPVVTRTAAEIDAVVALAPMTGIADDPSRLLVVFLDREPAPAAVATLEAAVTGDEVWEVHGRELHLWLPAGVADSAVNKLLMKNVLGVTWTGRNWATVLKIQAAIAQ